MSNKILISCFSADMAAYDSVLTAASYTTTTQDKVGVCEMRISQMEIPYLNANSIFVTSLPTKKKKVRSFPQVLHISQQTSRVR